MTRSRRFKLESALTLCASALAMLTAFVPDWIEATTGQDPDAGNGALEWGLVVVFAAVAVAGGLLARRDHARLAHS